MGQYLKSALILIVLCATACIVKAPDDGLGASVTAADIIAAVNNATDVSQKKAYHVGDFGTMQYTSNVLGNSEVLQTDQYKVTQIDSSNISYTIFHVDTGTSETGTIAVHPETSAVFKTLKKVYKTVARLFNKVQIESSKAIGQELKASKVKINSLLLTNSPLMPLEKSLKSQDLDASSSFTSKYYGLGITPHTYVTQNCSQIPNCTVNATRVEFNEVRTYTDGSVEKVHNTFEVTKEVPGLFLILSQCESKVVVQDDNEIPVIQCATVKNFQFGSPAN